MLWFMLSPSSPPMRDTSRSGTPMAHTLAHVRNMRLNCLRFLVRHLYCSMLMYHSISCRTFFARRFSCHFVLFPSTLYDNEYMLNYSLFSTHIFIFDILSVAYN